MKNHTTPTKIGFAVLLTIGLAVLLAVLLPNLNANLRLAISWIFMTVQVVRAMKGQWSDVRANVFGLGSVALVLAVTVLGFVLFPIKEPLPVWAKAQGIVLLPWLIIAAIAALLYFNMEFRRRGQVIARAAAEQKQHMEQLANVERDAYRTALKLACDEFVELLGFFRHVARDNEGLDEVTRSSMDRLSQCLRNMVQVRRDQKKEQTPIAMAALKIREGQLFNEFRTERGIVVASLRKALGLTLT